MRKPKSRNSAVRSRDYRIGLAARLEAIRRELAAMRESLDELRTPPPSALAKRRRVAVERQGVL